jgi:hypothetical protein
LACKWRNDTGEGEGGSAGALIGEEREGNGILVIDVNSDEMDCVSSGRRWG